MSVRNAAEILPAYLERLSDALQARFPQHEIVVVDDGSTDDTAARIKAAMETVPGVQFFSLTRRTGEHTALTAGLDQCIGDVVVTVEPPFDPPELVVEAAERVASDGRVVYGLDERRYEHSGALYRLLARGFTWSFYRTTGMQMPMNAAGLRAVSRQVLNNWLENRDRDRLLRVMPALSGSPYEVVRYKSRPDLPMPSRSVYRSFGSGVRAILASSAAPLRFASYLALVASFLMLLFALYAVGIATLRGDVVEGWLSLSLVLAGMFFIFSILLAILAEYVFQIVQRTHERPLYRIREEASSPESVLKRRLNVLAQKDPQRDREKVAD
jgi:glycosyltransferase involved in cell wall biosynthesis